MAASVTVPAAFPSFHLFLFPALWTAGSGIALCLSLKFVTLSGAKNPSFFRGSANLVAVSVTVPAAFPSFRLFLFPALWTAGSGIALCLSLSLSLSLKFVILSGAKNPSFFRGSANLVAVSIAAPAAFPSFRLFLFPALWTAGSGIALSLFALSLSLCLSLKFVILSGAKNPSFFRGSANLVAASVTVPAAFPSFRLFLFPALWTAGSGIALCLSRSLKFVILSGAKNPSFFRGSATVRQ